MTAQNLFNQCAGIIKLFPPETIRLPSLYPVAGRGFFPVTSGSFHNGCLTTEIAPRKLLFVGQDWGSEDNLSPLLSDKDADIKLGTGKILKDLLQEAAIPLEECFFTNALFGVREGKTNTGPSPGWKDSSFIEECTDAMKLQIETIQPKAIICLGRDAPALLVKLLPNLAPWLTAKTFTEIDKHGNAIIPIQGQSTKDLDLAAILVHPSFRHANVSRRRYKESSGHEAEVAILKDIWIRISQITNSKEPLH